MPDGSTATPIDRLHRLLDAALAALRAQPKAPNAAAALDGIMLQALGMLPGVQPLRSGADVLQALSTATRAVVATKPQLSAAALLRLMRRARQSADPVQSLAHLLTLRHTLPNGALRPLEAWPGPGLRALAATLGGSPAAARIVLRNPALAAHLFCATDISLAQSASALNSACRQCRVRHSTSDDLESALRGLRSHAWVRIVSRALGGLCEVETTLRELSDLADAVVDTLTRHHMRRARTQGGPWLGEAERMHPAGVGVGFAVIAQGKLGGRELNLSSDIDLQFVSDVPGASTIARADVHARLCVVAQRLVRGLSHSDAAGQGLRVDLDLRPEGKKGALVYSVTAMEAYYTTWGAPWERLALIRARHIAGAAWVSATLLQNLHSFIYPRHVAHDTIDKVRSVAVRIGQERRQNALAAGRAPGIDIKRDRGGIRDVELFVQTQQHLHGGRIPSLQTQSLMQALHALHLAGLMPGDTVHALRVAYRYLRMLENCVQVTEERQTHRLPETPEGLAFLAGQMQVHKGAPKLLHDIARVRRSIDRITRPLFWAPTKPATSALVASSRALCLTGVAQQAALEALGLRPGAWAQGIVAVLAQGRGGPLCAERPAHLEHLGPALLSAMAQSPDPPQALRLYADLDPVLRRAPGYFALLANAPTMRHRLMDLLGTSEFLSRTLVRFPDLTDWLVQTPELSVQRLAPDVDALKTRLDARLASSAPGTEAALGAICRFKMREQLRLGLLDLAQAITTTQLTTHLSMLAQVCLDAVLTLSHRALRDRTQGSTEPDAPVACDFVILALGRLGSLEMGYGSDLDLVFVWAPHTAQMQESQVRLAQAQALRLAQGCIAQLTARNLEGVLYPIDTRLRPSGNQGPLVTQATSFVAYYAEHAMLWERQALLRARPVAGDLALGRRVLGACATARYPKALPDNALLTIDAMRQRMHKARAQPTGAQRSVAVADVQDIKLGHGGLTDLEFAVQTLQLQHAHRHQSLQVTSTAQALAALGAHRIITPTRCAQCLRAYWYLRRLEGALRIVQDRALSALDVRGPGAKALARRMGYGHLTRPEQALERDWLRAAKHAHALYNHVLTRAQASGPRRQAPSAGTQA